MRREREQSWDPSLAVTRRRKAAATFLGRRRGGMRRDSESPQALRSDRLVALGPFFADADTVVRLKNVGDGQV